MGEKSEANESDGVVQVSLLELSYDNYDYCELENCIERKKVFLHREK